MTVMDGGLWDVVTVDLKPSAQKLAEVTTDECVSSAITDRERSHRRNSEI